MQVIAMSGVQEFNCIFCKDLFDNKEDLQIHFRKHGDPKFNQSVKNSKNQTMEGQSEKIGEDGQSDVVKCDVCSEVFPSISKAITHKHKMHPDHDAKYFCPWCGKLFTMKHLYNKHIQSNHDKENCQESGFHCDLCEVDFFMASAMVYHNKFFHRQDTELADIGHSRKMKLYEQDPLPIYYCPFCGEEYCNKVNLHKHMGDDHSDENQSPDDVLRCPLCAAIFYHLDAYELHLTFHSSEDLYSEENEMVQTITEFSLETVPPIMEKVENETEAEGTIGIEELLQQAMNESNDNSNCEGVPEKRKKKKKHKKKKTITLDEFLNMNKDVFGEGIGDVQGIEEVPTQVVAKQLKGRKQAMKKHPGVKMTSSAEIEKLKKQGIVVKKNPNISGNQFQGIKVLNSTVNKAHLNKVAPTTQIKPPSSSPNDVLARLQNSDIKIVKKSAQNGNSLEFEKSDDVEKCASATTVGNEQVSNQNISINGNEDNKDENVEQHNDHEKNTSEQDSNETNPPSPDEDITYKSNLEKKEEQCKSPERHRAISETKTDDNISKSSPSSPFNAFKSLSQHITIKSVSSPKSVVNKQKYQIENAELTDVDQDYVESKNDNIAEKNETTLNSIKNLSHLIVKSVNQNRKASSPVATSKLLNNEPNFVDNDTALDSDKETSELEKEADEEKQPTKSIDTLRNINSNITIKSLKQQSQSINKFAETSCQDSTNDDNDADCDEPNISNINKTQNIKLPSSVTVKNLVSPKVNNQSPSPKLKSTSKPLEKLSSTIDISVKTESSPKQFCTNILKQLPNITAKSLNTVKKLHQVTVKSSNHLTSIQKGNVNSKTSEESREEVEIFNIDDSDDELDKNVKHKINSNSSDKQKAHPEVIRKPDTFKNVNKNITVKNQEKITAIKKFDNTGKDFGTQQYDSDGSAEEDDDIQTTMQQGLSSLQNTLKNLGQHLTIKSNSPKIGFISQDMFNTNKAYVKPQMEENDSDSDPPSRVKITELDNEHLSDDEIINAKIIDNQTNKNAVVQSPDSNSDIEHQDMESLTKPSKMKQIQEKPDCLSNLKNITVKSSKEENVDENYYSDENDSEIVNETINTPLIPNLGRGMSIKPFKPTKVDNETKDDVPSNKNKQVSCSNKKMATSSNQVNTVNKEVTVQTLQTKTIIQEITTTVTKTIRTVNQTVKQEVKNTSHISQNTGMNIIRPQKIQGIRPNSQIRNVQGTPIRQAAPVMRQTIRSAVSHARPLGTVVRPSNQLMHVRPNVASSSQSVPIRPTSSPSNQLVPCRPGMTIRPSNPRMPVIRKPSPSQASTSQKPIIGKPLKISPSAMISQKRPNTDSDGPFSCFKKPKESAIPSFEDDDESTVFSSSSHMSKSNFCSTTKTVKGNSVVSTSQTSSEVNAQQISKLNSMSGLKVVKTSQARQTMQVAENSEVSASKRTALAAIERLQKQGLLVKKPRVEEENSDHSNSGDEDHYDDDT